MNEDICNYMEKFDQQTKLRFSAFHDLIYESTSQTINENLWAIITFFYIDKNFVRFIPFNDHVNIEAKAVLSHIHELAEYNVTPKGMLKIFHTQQLPSELLRVIFKESLEYPI